MASLRFLKNRKRWQVRFRATDRKTHYIFQGSRVFYEKAQAVKFYADIEAQERLIRLGQVVPSESLDNALENFMRHIKRHTTRTQQHYKMVIRLFMNSLPKSVIRIHQVEPAHIQEYLYQMNQRKNRTQNAHLTVIKAFCRLFSEKQKIANPASKIKMLIEDPPNSRFLTKDEYQKLLAVAPTQARNRIIFLANTGLRASELFQLSVKSLNPQATAITITGKGRRRRTVPLNQTARSVMLKVRPASKNALYLQFSRLAKKIGIEKFGPHALRHYCATQLLLGGVPTATVSKIMGVSIRIIEQHYSHILTSDIAHATDVLDSL